MPKTVLYVVPTLCLDGPGRVLLGIVRHLDRSRFRAIVCGVLASKAARLWEDGREAFREHGAAVVDLARAKPWDLFCLPGLLRVIHRFRPEIVHTHLARGHLYGRTAAALAGVPRLLSTVHSVEGWMRSRRPGLRAVRAADALTQGLTDCVVAVGRDVRDELLAVQGRRARRYEVVLSGIEPMPEASGRSRAVLAETAWPDGTVIVAYVGRLVEEKRLHVLVDAFARLARSTAAPVGLVLIGEGPEGGALAERAAAEGVSGRVHFTGQRQDVRTLLRGTDIFATSSRREGLSIATLEAMDASLPCVVSDGPGVGEPVIHEGTGLIVPDGRVDAMAEALGRLAADAALRRRLGQAGRRRLLETFTARTMSDGYQRLYTD